VHGNAAIEILATTAERHANLIVLGATDRSVFANQNVATRLRGEPLELVGVDDGHAGVLDGDPLVAAKLTEQTGDSFA
jgi:hypothetical protein